MVASAKSSTHLFQLGRVLVCRAIITCLISRSICAKLRHVSTSLYGE